VHTYAQRFLCFKLTAATVCHSFLQRHTSRLSCCRRLHQHSRALPDGVLQSGAIHVVSHQHLQNQQPQHVAAQQQHAAATQQRHAAALEGIHLPTPKTGPSFPRCAQQSQWLTELAYRLPNMHCRHNSQENQPGKFNAVSTRSKEHLCCRSLHGINYK
jgi:hypothetical protein